MMRIWLGIFCKRRMSVEAGTEEGLDGEEGEQVNLVLPPQPVCEEAVRPVD